MGSVNLIGLSVGTITREWPPTGAGGANAFPARQEWRSKTGASGPFVFVFELAAPAEIDSLVFQAYRDEQEAPSAAQSVHVEASTQGPDAGYASVGDYSLAGSNAWQNFHLDHPATARWLRVTIPQRGADHTSLSRILAYGKLQPWSPRQSLAGVWLLDRGPHQVNDKLFTGGARLASVPDPALVDEAYLMVQISQHGTDFRAASCHAKSGVDSVSSGSVAGAAVTWNVGYIHPGVLNAEGTVVAGGLSDDQDPYLLMRLPPGVDCAHVKPAVGSGQRVLVLSDAGSFDHYAPPTEYPAQFPGYQFVPLSLYAFTPDALDSAETVILSYVCDLGKKIAPWQAQPLLDFVKAGHKLIIADADKCTSTDYSFLPYQFKTSNPGGRGANSHDLIIVEPSALGTDVKDAPQYIDVKSWASDQRNQLGDANTVTTHDPHWCGHLFGTNALHVSGFMHMYAPFGQGLIIYNGFDEDDHGWGAFQRIAQLELQQQVPPLLPCTQSVAAKFLIAPSKQIPVAAGRAADVTVPLQVLPNLGYAGTVSLAIKAPAEAPWKSALSVSQVTLAGDVAPLTLTVSVPATVAAGDGHAFLVMGNDGQGDSASATITFVGAVLAPAKVEAVTNGCTEQLTVGSDAMFAFNEATLTAAAQQTLAALGPAVTKAGKHPIQINGYTDSVGTDAYNKVLSLQRARSVRDWLAAHHYALASTPIQGLGKQSPVAPNTNPNGSDNPAGRAKNRRVEVLIDTCK